MKNKENIKLNNNINIYTIIFVSTMLIFSFISMSLFYQLIPWNDILEKNYNIWLIENNYKDLEKFSFEYFSKHVDISYRMGHYEPSIYTVWMCFQIIFPLFILFDISFLTFIIWKIVHKNKNKLDIKKIDEKIVETKIIV